MSNFKKISLTTIAIAAVAACSNGTLTEKEFLKKINELNVANSSICIGLTSRDGSPYSSYSEESSFSLGIPLIVRVSNRPTYGEPSENAQVQKIVVNNYFEKIEDSTSADITSYRLKNKALFRNIQQSTSSAQPYYGAATNSAYCFKVGSLQADSIYRKSADVKDSFSVSTTKTSDPKNDKTVYTGFVQFKPEYASNLDKSKFSDILFNPRKVMLTQQGSTFQFSNEDRFSFNHGFMDPSSNRDMNAANKPVVSFNKNVTLTEQESAMIIKVLKKSNFSPSFLNLKFKVNMDDSAGYSPVVEFSYPYEDYSKSKSANDIQTKIADLKKVIEQLKASKQTSQEEASIIRMKEGEVKLLSVKYDKLVKDNSKYKENIDILLKTGVAKTKDGEELKPGGMLQISNKDAVKSSYSSSVVVPLAELHTSEATKAIQLTQVSGPTYKTSLVFDVNTLEGSDKILKYFENDYFMPKKVKADITLRYNTSGQDELFSYNVIDVKYSTLE